MLKRMEYEGTTRGQVATNVRLLPSPLYYALTTFIELLDDSGIDVVYIAVCVFKLRYIP